MTLYEEIKKRIGRMNLTGIVGITDLDSMIRFSFTSFKDMNKITKWLEKNYPDNDIKYNDGILYICKQTHKHGL